MSASESLRQETKSRGTWDDVRDLPPSAKLVAKVLEYNETMTQQEIAEETLLPARTVRYALNRLDEENVIDSRFSFSDARKRLYSLEIDE
ncbi:winged helix-turn-helix domain-containing protein [Halobacteria archaeon AArc-m2/3/4]|uniref:Winged helix-turn-helix domain-containing protein n=1 Tax=Natronoglomus mannanivorans TaxID=2979990 RepID=A0AAP2YVK7_9EURY|nr:winged helix-turn-helix domain-containing protein [Halobacteria archaeon AArc-xg1-1]MCU4971709.1 winged helix-turn-helix domain-containing protein [Halobacteria archaeon AArc-m2/3/4]